MDASRDILFFILICLAAVRSSRTSDVPPPDNLTVDIWDGEVTVLWDAPGNAPPETRYSLQLTKSNEEWADVGDCVRVQKTYCDVTGLIDSYTASYKVKVQLLTDQGLSPWTKVKKFLPNKSQLSPPSFTLLATSSTLTVTVHRRPILMRVFHYGLTYTIHLEERAHGNKTSVEVAYLKDDVLEEAKGAKTFRSLRWGTEYCVSLRVEGNGALFSSKPSQDQCISLPKQEWFLIAVSSLTVLGVIGVLITLLTVVFYFLRRPEKTPVALKAPPSGWSPLTVGEGPIEVVTDKGWFLLSISESRVDKTWTEEEKEKDTETPPRAALKEEDEAGGEAGGGGRSSDSGVSMKEEGEAGGGGRSSDSGVSMKSSRRPTAAREDSGCGSLGESPRQDRRDGGDRGKEDSGMGLSSGSLEEQGGRRDCGPLPKRVLGGSGDGYRGQSPSFTLVQTAGAGEDGLKQTALAAVVTGYRSGHLACVCLGAGRCIWCRTTGRDGRNDGRIVDALGEEGDATFSGYRRKTHIRMETLVSMDDSETQTANQTPVADLGGVFSLLTALSSSLPPVEDVTNCSMNSIFLTLSDVELRTD